MPNQTTNYNLTKPLETERYDVQVFNNNADIIDAQMKSNADGIANVNSRLDNLNNWTTVEFTLADFTYDEKSGWSTFRIELPDGYILAEARGYYVLNNVRLNSNSTLMGIEPTTRQHDNESAGLVNQALNTDVMADSGTFEASYNNDLNIYTIQYIHSTRTSNVEWDAEPLSGTGIYRSKSIMNSNWFTNNSLTIKTNVPYPNLLDFYGKLQYRVVPAS